VSPFILNYSLSPLDPVEKIASLRHREKATALISSQNWLCFAGSQSTSSGLGTAPSPETRPKRGPLGSPMASLSLNKELRSSHILSLSHDSQRLRQPGIPSPPQRYDLGRAPSSPGGLAYGSGLRMGIWGTGLRAPYTPRAGQVPTPVAFRDHPPPTMGRTLRRHSGGPTDKILAKGATPRPRPHPPWRRSTPAPGIAPRREHPLHDVSLWKGRRREMPCYLTSGAAGPRPRNTSERPRGSPPTTCFNVFSFTPGLLATETPSHTIVSDVLERTCGGPRGPRGSEELPHHAKVAPQSGEYMFSTHTGIILS